MPTVVLKLFAGQGTRRLDGLTDGQAATICFPLQEIIIITIIIII